MTCEQVRQALSAQHDQPPLKPDEPMVAHLAECESCREVGADYADLDQALQRLYRPEFDPAVLTRALKHATRVAPIGSVRRWRALGAAAAAAALLCGGIMYWLSVEGQKPMPQVAALGTSTAQPTRFDIEGAHVRAARNARLFLTQPRHVRQSEGVAQFKVTPGQGAFLVETPHGTVIVKGTDFVVAIEPLETKVVVREGLVDVNGAGSTLALKAPQSARLAEGSPPQSIAPPSWAKVILWVPWSFLDTEEAAARVAYLKQQLSDESVDGRLEARQSLLEGLPAQTVAVISWLEEGTPRLQLEAVLTLRHSVRGDAQARAALKQFARLPAQSAALRAQAIRSLGAVGTSADLDYLEQLLLKDSEPNEIRAAAAEAIRLIKAAKE